MHRRLVLAASGLAAAGAMAGLRPMYTALAAAPQGEAEPFDFERLKNMARQRAAAGYRPPRELGGPLAELGYDDYRDIRFRPEQALWRNEGLPFELQFFHPGWVFTKPVALHVVDKGVARRVSFLPEDFTYGRNEGLRSALPSDLDFSGFRIHAPLNRPDYFDEIAVFQGASYFRSLGKGQNYGVSARGLAIDTAVQSGEEFPDFRAFWIARPAPGDAAITVFALLDSPSMSGAYRFVITPGDTTTMHVALALYPRRKVERLGIAPLTSMYLFGENGPDRFDDFRPEVHDSDGLLLQTGNGEWIWRPLANPQRLRQSLYGTENLQGFGLLQRDRAFMDYQDLEARYDRRPSAWIKPLGPWGKGTVQLVEIPSDAEIHDNIVAFWWPQQAPEPGQELALEYELLWGPGPACPGGLALAAATRIGAGKEGSRRFVVDFVGCTGAPMPPAGLQAEVSNTAGAIAGVVTQPNTVTGGWRVFFDLQPQGSDVIELRCLLRQGEAAASETWSYQWTPS